MKIFNTMGYRVKRYLLMTVISLAWMGCETEPEVPGNGSTTDLVHSDPFIQVVTAFLQGAVGTPAYAVEFNAINGTEGISSVRLIGTYFDPASGLSSNEVVYGEYDTESPQRTVITDEFTYEELRTGVLVDGEPIPATDAGLADGAGWAFRFEGVKGGESIELVGEINLVFSKYAGNYLTGNTHYMRIQPDAVIFPPPVVDGVPTYDGIQVFIGYVNGTTLSYNDRWGYFAWPGKEFHFSYDTDGNITGFAFPNGSFSGTPATCFDSPTGFDNLSAYLGYDVCVESLTITDNDVTGEHVIKLTYGYLGGGGYRQFTETLTKIVN